MKQRVHYLLTILTLLFCVLRPASGFAQGVITTEPLRVTAVCSGSSFEVMFTTDSPYGSDNVFTAELFDGTTYRSLLTSTAKMVATNRASAVWRTTVTIPDGATPGVNYQLRIKASKPAVAGSLSLTQLSVRSRPAKPIVPTAPTVFCQGQTTSPLSATTTGDSLTLLWYGTDPTGGTGAPEATAPSSVSAGTFQYYVAQWSGECESERAVVPVLINLPPQASLTGSAGIYAGQPASLSVVFSAGGPWRFSYRDSSSATGVWGAVQTVETSDNPHVLTVNPAQTTAYQLTGVTNACGSGTSTDSLAVVNVAPLLGVDDSSLADAVDVYPIPATTTLTVRIRGLTTAHPAFLQLTDLTGRTAQIQTEQETTSLSLGAYPAGTYILRIRVGDRTASKRIVKW